MGQKEDGTSEFIYYPFRSAEEPGDEPTFQEWLDVHHRGRFVVHEFPTIDWVDIAPERAQQIAGYVAVLLDGGRTVVMFDSAGAKRTRAIRKALRAISWPAS